MGSKHKNNITGRDIAAILEIDELEKYPSKERCQKLYATKELYKNRLSDEKWIKIQDILKFFAIQKKINKHLEKLEKQLTKELELFCKQEKGLIRKSKSSPRVASDTELRKFKLFTELMSSMYEIIEPSFADKSTSLQFWDGPQEEGKDVVRNWIAKLIAAIINHYFYPFFLTNPFTEEQVRKRIKSFQSK